MDSNALQALLSAGQLVDGNGQAIQLVALPTPGSSTPKLFQLVTTGDCNALTAVGSPGNEGGLVVSSLEQHMTAG